MNKLALLINVLVVTLASNEQYEHRRESCDRICESDMYDIKVCGSDGVLYKSTCEFDRAHCVAEQKGDTLSVYSVGDCITLNSTCEVVNDPTTRCESKDVNMLCASNNFTYDSVCAFMVARCRYHGHTPIRVLHTGACVYDLSKATKLNCSDYAIDTSQGLAIENGTMPHLTFNCPHHPVNSSICLLNGRSFSDSCRYCQKLSYEGIITVSNLVTYIQHKGRCHHTVAIG